MAQPSSIQQGAPSSVKGITKDSFVALANLLEGNTRNPFARKKNPQAEALREAGDLYQQMKFVAAYQVFKAAHEKVVSDMQRVVARNADFEANKLVKEQKKTLAAAKETVVKLKAYAQQVIDQFDFMLKDLENKRIVREYIENGGSDDITENERDEAAETNLSRAGETHVESKVAKPEVMMIGHQGYQKAPYAPPKQGAIYSVRDKTRGERVIRVVGASDDGSEVEVEVVEEGKASKRPIQLAVESLVRQAEKGWCSLLLPIVEERAETAAVKSKSKTVDVADLHMRLDIQNFGRCCGDIVRANIPFETQLIKDIGDGPFRSGNYEQAFTSFEQCAMKFNAAVASSRREIAQGRQALNAQKTKVSGKEIQEKTAAFVRSEQLIHTAEREFSTILEGLRMYLRAQQDASKVGE